MSTSSLWQKIGASAVNCSLALLLSVPIYLCASVEFWKISTVAIFFIYNVLFRSRCLGMRLVGTYIEPPTSVWYAALYSLGFSTFFYSVWIPGDLLTANAVIQIGSVTMTGNTAHALLAGQGTMSEQQYINVCKNRARLLWRQGMYRYAVDSLIHDFDRWPELRIPTWIQDMGRTLADDNDEPGVRLWIDGMYDENLAGGV